MIHTQPDFLKEGEGGGAAAGGVASVGGVGAADAGGAEAAVPMQDCPSIDQVAIDTTKVLGKCDHKHDGYMSKNCFHIPKKVMPTLHRWELCNGGSKRKKTKNGKDKKYYHEKGMKVITSYEDLVEALGDGVKPVFIFNIPHGMVDSICSQEQNDNKFFSKSQLMKYIGDNDVEFVGLFSNDSMKICYAMAALKYDEAGQDDCYIAEVQSFKKGYGKALIKRILDSQERTWLLANPGITELVKYYRDPDFGLNEIAIADSIWKRLAGSTLKGKDAHFFFTDGFDKEKLEKFLKATYGNKEANCSEDEDNSPAAIVHQGKSLAQWERELKGEFTISQLTRMAMSGCDIQKLAANINGVTSLEDSELDKTDPFRSMMNAMNNKETVDANGVEFSVTKDDASPFEEINANDVVQADNVFFANDFTPMKKKHIYTIAVTSMNNDDSLDFNDQIISDKALSFSELVAYIWPKLPKGYGIKGDFAQTTKEYFKKVKEAKEQLRSTGSIEGFQKIATEPFPILKLSYGNSTRDMIEMTPVEEDFNAMTQKGIPAAYVVSDDDANLTFNQYATDKIYANQVIGESKALNEAKNKITGKPETKECSLSEIKPKLKFQTKKVEKVAQKKDAKYATQVPQPIKHVRKVSKPLSSKMMVRTSLEAKKHSKKVPEISSFSKSKLEIKKISFPRSEAKTLKKQDQIVTSRVSDEYDAYQVGDIVKTTWGSTYKVVAKQCITSVTKHPFLKELTDHQVEELSDFDKIAVLTLNKQEEYEDQT